MSKFKQLGELIQELSPVEKVEFMRRAYDIFENDETIRCDEQALKSFTMFTIDINDAIIQSNELKQRIIELENEVDIYKIAAEELTEIKNKHEIELREIKTRHLDQVSKIKQEYETKISEMTKHYDKKSISSDSDLQLLETGDIPNNINDCVKIQCGKISDMYQIQNKSENYIKDLYKDEQTNGKSMEIRVFSKYIQKIDISKCKNKSEWNKIETYIMKQMWGELEC